MPSEWDVPRWHRSLAVTASACSTWLLSSLLVTLQDAKRSSDLHWGNGGEEQIVILLGVVFVLVLLVVAFPLALFVPIKFQRTRGPVVMGFAFLIPPAIEILLVHESPRQLWHEIGATPWFYACVETLSILWCGQYLLLLRWLTSTCR